MSLYTLTYSPLYAIMSGTFFYGGHLMQINLNPLNPDENSPKTTHDELVPIEQNHEVIKDALQDLSEGEAPTTTVPISNIMDSPDAKLKYLKSKINEELANIQPLVEEFQTASAEVEAAMAVLRAAQNKKNAAIIAQQEADRKRRELEAEARRLEQEIADAKRKAEEEAAAEIARQQATMQIAELDKRFDLGTMGAPWREWAKDHQLFAGKTIARQRRVLLADAMGLGKTLSATIVSEMAQAVTKEASPDFPILGEEREVYVPQKVVWTQKGYDAALKNEWPFGGQTKLSDQLVKTQGPTPFDDPSMRLGMNGLKVGAQIGYIEYDLKSKLLAEGYIERTEAYYEKKIFNSITRPVGRKILYFCPAALLRNVLEEYRRWTPHRNVTYIGAMSKAERQFALQFLPDLDNFVVIINYEAWRRDLKLLDDLIDLHFDTIIIDEAHNIKDMKSQAYKGVEKVVSTLDPEYLIPMTGTPLLNRPQEFFTLLHLMFPQQWYNEKDFLLTYCEEYYPLTIDGEQQTTNPKWKFQEDGWDRLLKKIDKYYLRRTKEDAGIILPEKVIVYHDIELDVENYPLQAKARKDMKDFATLIIDSKKGQVLQATVVIALITRLRQIETWPAGIRQVDPKTKEVLVQLDVHESQKIDYTIRFDTETNEWEGLIPNHIEDERIVVFSQFKAPLHELKRRIEQMGKKAVIIDGDTPQSLRDEARIDFDRRHTPNRADAKWDVALCNYKAAGVGLNLTAATNMVVLDSEWNPGKRDQAFDRLHRIGQTENVTINVLSVKSTIDDWLDQLMKDKEGVVTGAEATHISGNDLMNAIESGLI